MREATNEGTIDYQNPGSRQDACYTHARNAQHSGSPPEAGRFLLETTSQLFLAVIAKTLLQVRSVFWLPQWGQDAAPIAASEIGREISNVLWQSWQVNS
jgi:hypothetical protein